MVSVVRDVGQVTVLSPIARKRRVNQQEMHQLSIDCHFVATNSKTVHRDNALHTEVELLSCKLLQCFPFLA